MKLSIVFFTILSSTSSALAEEKLYLPDFVESKTTGASYIKLIESQKLPAWVKSGGTSSPAHLVYVEGKKFIALSGCKPHDCPTQSISVLYSPEDREIHGLYSEYDQRNKLQHLKWLNLDPSDKIQLGNLLYLNLISDNIKSPIYNDVIP